MVFHWPQVVLLLVLVLPTIIDVFANKRSWRYVLWSVVWDGFLFWLLYAGGFLAGAHP
jgi:hypothetical protein